jgi:hypothetical protein
MCFKVPFLHPLGQIETSLSTIKWHFSHSLCVYSAILSLIWTNNDILSIPMIVYDSYLAQYVFQSALHSPFIHRLGQIMTSISTQLVMTSLWALFWHFCDSWFVFKCNTSLYANYNQVVKLNSFNLYDFYNHCHKALVLNITFYLS